MHNIWYGKLARRLDEISRDSIDRITQGACGDFAWYKYHVGYLKGLRDALEAAEEVDREQMGM